MLCLVEIDTSDQERAAREVCQLFEVAIERAIAEVKARKVPALHSSGVRYASQPANACAFRPPSQVFARKAGDCKQLCLWRAAEHRLIGVHATPRIIWLNNREGLLAHMVLRLPDSNIEDPSVELGMGEF